MTKDLRSRNHYFDKSDIHLYLKEYSETLAKALQTIPKQNMDAAMALLKSGGTIFVGGNGGSASISDHLVCDFVKGTQTETFKGLKVHSLLSSQALFTAIANDCGYEKTFSFQLDAANICAKDTVILISSSGNSPNIIAAAACAKFVKANIIGLTGFDGGKLKEMCDVSLHIPVDNYGVIEDCHQALMHVLAQFYYWGGNEETRPSW